MPANGPWVKGESGDPPVPAFRLAAGVTVLYVLLGAAGLTLAVPPGYASPVFPAAGLALAAVLRFGPVALPGVFTGSALLNLLHAWLGGPLTPATAAAAAVIAAGAAAQAWAGGRLVERWRGAAWRTLEREQDAIGFLLLGGGLATLLSASVAALGLRLLGVIGAAETLDTWGTWYVGDSLGVMVFTPLSLSAIDAPGGLWRARRWRLVPPMLATLGVVLFAFLAAARSEKAALDARLASDGGSIVKGITDRLIAHREVLSSVRRFAEATPGFTFRQFEQFTRRALRDHPDISALSFNDLVRDEERDDYERRMSGLSPLGAFRITERDAQRRIVPAARRPEYVVVRAIVPLEGNEAAVGFDIASEPIRRQAVERSRASDRMAATATIPLVQEARPRVGLLEMLPVQREPEMEEGGERRPAGFAVAVLKVDEMIEIAIRGRVPSGVVFRLTDSRAPKERSLLYRSDARAGGAASPLTEDAEEWSAPLLAGYLDWTVSASRTADYARRHRPWVAWAVGVTGLAFATLLQVFLLGMTGRERGELERDALLLVLRAAEAGAGTRELLARTHEAVGTVIRAESFSAVLRDPATGLFEEVYRAGERDAGPGPPAEPLRGPTRHVLRTGQAVLLTPELLAELRSRGEADWAVDPPAAWLGAPLRIGGQAFGVLAVHDSGTACGYSERDRAFLGSVASLVALAVGRR